MTSVVHGFEDSLNFSHDQADQPWWETVYRRAFPDLAGLVDLRDDGWHQRAGRDRALVLTSGRTVYVDEKVRRKAYDDVALEIWSQYPKNAPRPYRRITGAKDGWALEPKDCDWLAYAFLPTQRCYLFPFLGVRAALQDQKWAWVENAQEGKAGFRWVKAENRNYDTISIAVPISVLQEAISSAMTIDWGAA